MSGRKRRRSSLRNFFKLVVAALALAAVIKELRLPKEERTWHGALGGFIPYDFRMPTVDKIRTSMWNPEGALFVDRPFGVGWTLNIGAVFAKVRSMSDTGRAHV